MASLTLGISHVGIILVLMAPFIAWCTVHLSFNHCKGKQFTSIPSSSLCYILYNHLSFESFFLLEPNVVELDILDKFPFI